MKLAFDVSIIYLGRQGELTSAKNILEKLSAGKLEIEYVDEWLNKPVIIVRDKNE